MSELAFLPEAAGAMADKLLADIRARDLTAGDRYFNAEQAARMLGVSKQSANRVLQSLASEGYLIRRQRSGTFIGPRIQRTSPAGRCVVQLLLHPDHGWGLLSCDELLAGLQDALPGASVLFTMLPERDPASLLETLLSEARAADWSLGLVPVSCPREVYKFLLGKGVPTVVLGSLFPDTDSIPSIDGDYEQVGRLLVEYVLKQGRRRIGLFTWQSWLPGDNALLESINRTLAAAHLPSDSLVVRSVPNDEPLFELEVRRLLELEDRPTALIFRTQAYAQLAARLCASMGLRVPDDVLIVHEGASTGVYVASPFPHVVRKASFRELAAMIGKMLAELMNRQPLKESRVVIPVELRDLSASVPSPKAWPDKTQ